MRLTKNETQTLERLMYLVAVIRENDLLDNLAVDTIIYDGAECDGYALDEDLKIALDEVSLVTGIEIPYVEEYIVEDDLGKFDRVEYNSEEEYDDA